MPNNNNTDVREDIKFLVDTFKLERWVNIILSSVSFGVVIWAVISMAQSGEAGFAEITASLGGGGAAMYSLSQLMRMYNDAQNMVRDSLKITEVQRELEEVRKKLPDQQQS